MPKWLNLLVLSFFFLSFVSYVSAHGSGPPILSINGTISNNNPIFTSSTTEIDLGMDIGPKNYVINEPITFELNRTNLPAPKEVVDRSTFNWDFTDGGKETGLKSTHTFTKPGTYIVKITVTDPSQDSTFDLDTVQVNVLPSSDYKPPVAKIKINGKIVNDPLKDTFKIQKGDNLEFDASESKGDKLTYQWDFGDGTAEKGRVIKHVYAADFFPSFPLLRVTDKNGISNDAFVEFFDKKGGSSEGFFPNPNYKTTSQASTAAKQANQTKSKNSLPVLPLTIGIGFVLLGFTTFVLLKFGSRKK